MESGGFGKSNSGGFWLNKWILFFNKQGSFR